MMKKLIFSIFLTIFGTCYAPEFKGSSAIIPRINEETPRPSDYLYYTPTQENIRQDSFLCTQPRCRQQDTRIYYWKPSP